MDRATTIEPIHKTVTVNRPVQEAFDLFTAGMASWWPLETHSIHHDAHRAARGAVVFEPREGGRVFERTVDGREANWARVVAWDPPRRLVLAWRPNLEPGPTTEVEVTFTPESAERTRVDLVHGGWEALGERAREAHDSYNDWERVLGLYAGAA